MVPQRVDTLSVPLAAGVEAKSAARIRNFSFLEIRERGWVVYLVDP